MNGNEIIIEKEKIRKLQELIIKTKNEILEQELILSELLEDESDDNCELIDN